MTAELKQNILTLKINNQPVDALVDTGAAISCISQKELTRVCKNISLTPAKIPCILDVNGGQQKPLGCVSLGLLINRLEVVQTFHVFETLHCKVILGMDFLEEKQAKIDIVNRTLSLYDGMTETALKQPGNNQMALARTVARVSIPAQSECDVPVTNKKISNGTVLVEPVSHLMGTCSVFGARSVDTIAKQRTTVRILNPTNRTITLRPGKVLATIQPLSAADIEKDDQHIKTEANGNISGETVNTCDSGGDRGDEQYIRLAEELDFNFESSDLTPAEKQTFLAFLGRNRDVFAKDLSELGCTDLYQHKIETGDAPAVRQRFYRTNPKQKAEIDRQVEEMLEHDIIQPSSSDWHSPVVLVRKPSGESRFCVDYRGVNRVSRLEVFPLPRLDDMLDSIGESSASYFSVCDMSAGFWQIPLCPSTAHKSAFIIHNGIYEFKRMPFGLANNAMSFQMVMTQVLRGLAWKIAMCYIDDILVFSKNLTDHLAHLQAVFDRLRSANLKLKPSKCRFATREVKYLGNIVTKSGVKVDPAKTKAMTDFPRPKNQHDLRSYLGLCNYYKRYVKGYSTIASPLYHLLKQDVDFTWTDQCEESFQNLKIALTSAPVLAYPDMNKQFILSCDASGTAISYILGQKDSQNREHPIAYGGRALTVSEKKFSISERECLALVEGVRHYRHFLEHQKFVIITDHAALKWLQDLKHSSGRLSRWSMLLQGFQYDVQYKPGIKHQNADALSRRNYPECDTENAENWDLSSLFTTEVSQPAIVTLEYAGQQQVYTTPGEPVPIYSTDKQAADQDQLTTLISDRLQELKDLQSDCPDLTPIKKYLDLGELPADQQRAIRIVAESEQYIVDNGILYHLWDQRARKIPKPLRMKRQLAVPTTLRLEILENCHDSVTGGAHQGFDRTYTTVSSSYYWPRMYTQIKDYVKSCTQCQQAKRPVQPTKAPLHPLPSVATFERWHIDILGPLTKTSDNYQYILLCVDSFSRFVEAFPLKTQEATEVADILYKDIICRYGAMTSLVSDRGTNFMSKVVSELCKVMDIKRLHTSPYHPQTNSTCERFNRTLAQSIRTYIDKEQQNWVQVLPGILMAYRKTESTHSTGYSPFELVFGQTMRAPVDVMFNPQSVQGRTSESASSYFNKLQHQLKVYNEVAKDNVKRSQEHYKEHYDRKAVEPNFNLGQRVWLHNSKIPVGKSAKLHIKWTGPYYICDIGPNHTYMLRHGETHKTIKTLIHANRLKLHCDPDIRDENLIHTKANLRENQTDGVTNPTHTVKDPGPQSDGVTNPTHTVR
ncbi:MAG: RNase H-like domain-containing protein, partial [Sedimenticola sp.]